jgi:hypothetical protein
MRSEFASRVPKSSVLYRTPELPIGRLQPLVLKALRALQALSPVPQKVKIVEDWLDHDGLEFAKGVHPLADIFAIASTPRSLFEKTPKEDSVFLRAEAEDGSCILRVRTDWDEEVSLVASRGSRRRRRIWISPLSRTSLLPPNLGGGLAPWLQALAADRIYRGRCRPPFRLRARILLG